MNTTITATAKYIPEKILSNFDLEKIVDTTDDWIKSRTGITKRHIVQEGEATSDMCANIAKKLFSDGRVHHVVKGDYRENSKIDRLIKNIIKSKST